MAASPAPYKVGSHRRFHTRKNYLASTVATTLTQVCSYEPRRIVLAVINLDAANSIYLGIDNTVSSTSGLQVGPAGTSFVSLAREDGELTTLPWYAIAVGGTCNVWVLETLANDPIDLLSVLLGQPAPPPLAGV